MDQTLRDLHERLLRGDEAAREELAARLLPVLHRRLRRHPRLRRLFFFVPPDLITDAVEDTIVEYLAAPQRIDLGRGVPLDACLEPATLRNLWNRLRSEKRWRGRIDGYAQHVVRQEPKVEAQTFDSGDESEAVWDQIMTLVEEGDRPGFLLWRSGAGPLAIAQALGLSHLAPSEQRQAVKRFKQRIVKRLRTRLGTMTKPPRKR